MNNVIVHAEDLEKAFHHPELVHILRGVSLDVHCGTSIAITGRSGEGKTTLLHLLATLEPFDRGTLWIAGEPISPKRAPALRNRYFGFVFQSCNLLEDLTAIENVLMPARIARADAPRAKGLALLAQVGLAERADFPVKLLSGGERQRVAIARALCNDPELIFADEPCGNLDKANADAIGQLLFSLVRERKKALVLVTHDPSLASRCDRQLVLADGKLS